MVTCDRCNKKISIKQWKSNRIYLEDATRFKDWFFNLKDKRNLFFLALENTLLRKYESFCDSCYKVRIFLSENQDLFDPYEDFILKVKPYKNASSNEINEFNIFCDELNEHIYF